MFELYNLNMAHPKDPLDTKKRGPIGRPKANASVAQSTRWAKVTSVNGDGTYEVDEVDENGDVLSDRSHSNVENISTATLVVDDIAPLFIRDGVFFFARL